MNSETQGKTRIELVQDFGIQLNALISASHALNVRTAAVFDPSVQPAAFLLVRWLLSNGPASAGVLAEATAMDRSSVTRLVSQLKHRDYVQSEGHELDRRVVLISLTELGTARASQAIQEKGEEFYGRISRLDNRELETFIRLLRCFHGQALIDPIIGSS